MGDYAKVLIEVDRADRAEPLYAEILDLNRQRMGEFHPDTLDSLNSYAGVLLTLQRMEEAEPIFAEVVELNRFVYGENHQKTLLSLNNYARVLSDLGREDKAEENFQQALNLSRAILGNRHPQTLLHLNNYAGFLTDQGRPAEAELLFIEALEIRRETLGEENPYTINSVRNYGLVLRALGRDAEAEPFLARALQLRRENLGEDHPDTLDAEKDLAEIHLALGRYKSAISHSRAYISAVRARALALSENTLRGYQQTGRELARHQQSERFHADTLWSNLEGKRAESRETLHEALTSLQFASAGSSSRAVAEAAAVRFASSSGLQSLVQERQDLTRLWIALEEKTIDAQIFGSSIQDERPLLQTELRTIESRIESIDAQIAVEAPNYFAIRSPQAINLTDLRAVLGTEEAVLMLVPTERGTHALAITDEAIEWARSDINDRRISEKITAFREGLEVGSGGALPVFDFDLAHKLYAELIAPVESALQGKTRVYVVADGALSRIPLGTLLTAPLDAAERTGGPARETVPEPTRATLVGTFDAATPPEPVSAANAREDFLAAQWLADRYALVTLPSLQSLVYIRSYGFEADEAQSLGYIGFGDPILAAHASRDGRRAAGASAIDAADLVGDTRSAAGVNLMSPASLRQMKSLPGTKRELETVSRFLGASNDSLFLAEAMTEPAIRNADLSSTRILHLATHGLTSEEGNRFGDLAEPGLVFTPPERSSAADDGYLAASEVVGLDLTRAEWVILSACNTAAPSGKPGQTGLSGLAQAFFYAGAESLLVSHWPVFDRIAPVLTAETLKRSEAGMSRAEALQAAMQEVRKSNPHPAAWAPFVLVGEGR